MGSIIGGLMGAGQSQAQKAQKLAREQQAVDQQRQLQQMNTENARTTLVRRNPRGRRLLADASTSSLPSTVA